MNQFKNIELSQEMYQNPNKTFTQVLEELDPSVCCFGTSLDELDAFQRQLKRFDIKVSGSNSDCVEKFFKTYQSSILFPEYVRRQVLQGYRNTEEISKIIASKTIINSCDYRSVYVDNIESDKEHTIKIQENLVQLHKRGKLLNVNYGTVRFQRLDLFGIALQQIGRYIAQAQMMDLINCIVNNNNVHHAYNDFHEYIDQTDVNHFQHQLYPFDFNTIFIPYDCSYFGGKRQGVLKMPPRFNNLYIGIDKNYCIEMVQSNNIYIDYPDLINKDFERAEIYGTVGFNVLNPKAVAIVELNRD